MTLDCCNHCIEQVKTTSNYCVYLEDQLFDVQTRSAQRAEDVTRVNEKLTKEESYTKSLNKAYEDVKENLKRAESQSERLRLDH